MIRKIFLTILICFTLCCTSTWIFAEENADNNVLSGFFIESSAGKYNLYIVSNVAGGAGYWEYEWKSIGNFSTSTIEKYIPDFSINSSQYVLDTFPSDLTEPKGTIFNGSYSLYHMLELPADAVYEFTRENFTWRHNQRVGDLYDDLASKTGYIYGLNKIELQNDLGVTNPYGGEISGKEYDSFLMDNAVVDTTGKYKDYRTNVHLTLSGFMSNSKLYEDEGKCNDNSKFKDLFCNQYRSNTIAVWLYKVVSHYIARKDALGQLVTNVVEQDATAVNTLSESYSAYDILDSNKDGNIEQRDYDGSSRAHSPFFKYDEDSDGREYFFAYDYTLVQELGKINENIDSVFAQYCEMQAFLKSAKKFEEFMQELEDMGWDYSDVVEIPNVSDGTIDVSKIKVEHTVDDARWTSEWLADHYKENSTEVKAFINNFIANDEKLKEYANTCMVNLTDVLYTAVLDKLKELSSGTTYEGENVFELTALVEEVENDPNVVNVLLMNMVADSSLYDLLFLSSYYASDGTSTGLFTKSMLERAKDQLTPSDYNKAKEAFKQVYYAQKNINVLIDELTVVESFDTWGLGAAKDDWLNILKDKALFAALNGSDIIKGVNNGANEYGALPTDAGVNSMSDYEGAYFYMFATPDQLKGLNAYGINLAGINVAEYNFETIAGKLERPLTGDGDYETVGKSQPQTYQVALKIDDYGKGTIYHKASELGNAYKPTFTNRENLLWAIFLGKIDVASFMAYKDKEPGTYVLNDNRNLKNGLDYTFFNPTSQNNLFLVKQQGYTIEGNSYDLTLPGRIDTTYFYRHTNNKKGTYYLEIRRRTSSTENILEEFYKWMRGSGIYMTAGELEPDRVRIPLKAELVGKKLYVYEPSSEKGKNMDWLYLSSIGLNVVKKQNNRYIQQQGQGINYQDVESIYLVFEQEETTTINIHYTYSGIMTAYNQLQATYKIDDVYDNCRSKAMEAQKTINLLIDAVKNNTDFKGITTTTLNELKARVSIDYGDDYESCRDVVDVSPICKDDWWVCAYKFFKTGTSNGQDLSGVIMLDELQNLIFDIGNMIFILITAFLGVKYIWGSSESKFTVKTSLVTLIVAAMVFYGWNAITNVVDIEKLLTGTTASTGYQNFAVTIYEAIMYVINVAAIGGIIYLGVKYMMAGADGKAELKVKLIPVIMGVIMVYGTVNLIGFILDITVRSL